MAISVARATAHVSEWQRNIRGPKQFWPAFVYHTAHVTVIPEILRSGLIIPRANQNQIIFDVAAHEPLWRNPSAHCYSRLYFRPKTLFHVVKEGIRCLRDSYRTPTQMSVPVILAFDSVRVLSAPGVRYTKQKFADREAELGSSEEFFDSIDFAAVFQDGPTQDANVRHKRMAEVLYDGQLPLDGNLKFIVCRTAYDRATLLSLLTPEEQSQYGEMIKIEKINGTAFMHVYSLYITDIKFYNGQLKMQLKHPSRIAQGGYKCLVQQIRNNQILVERRVDIAVSTQPVVIGGFQETSDCIWRIELEEALAFMGGLPSANTALV